MESALLFAAAAAGKLPVMFSKELCSTGIQLPEIGFGTWCYQGGVEPLREAIAQGATFIDTAESYGTEEIVGQALKGLRDQVFLATKISPRHFRRQDVIRSAEESLRRLNTDYLDLYQLHWPNYHVPVAETMAAMEELVAAGKIRFIGVSNFSEQEVERAQAALSKNRIVSNQVLYSLVERTIEDGLLQYCEARQITILAYSPLARGLQNIRSYDQDDVLGAVAAGTGKTRAQVALNWCVRHPSVIALFKADKVEHVRDGCGGSGWKLDPEEVAALNRIRFRRRRAIERFAWRQARRVAQMVGRSL
jgi:diketogulonate reductase-like aldo/keto reductase